jgi:hypothetical protein
MPESAGVNFGVRSQAGQAVKPERNFKRKYLLLGLSSRPCCNPRR